MKELNKELSRKLEAQTQRLELLTSQSMASDNVPAEQPDSHTTFENAPYADEGDEVPFMFSLFMVLTMQHIIFQLFILQLYWFLFLYLSD